MKSIRYTQTNKNKEVNGIFTPVMHKTLTQDDILHYLENLEAEIEIGLFTQNELHRLLEEALYGKFINKSKRLYFLYHFLPLWMDSVRTLFHNCPKPRIIELGCGSGTSSLLFAMLGARVIGIEMDADLVRICNKRKKFYEGHVKNLDVAFHEANAFDFPFTQYEPVDAFFSLFAFNLMKPANLLIDRIVPSLKNGGKIMLIDGNTNSFYSQLLPSRRRPGVLSPAMMKRKMERRGCEVSKIDTHCALPPFAFKSFYIYKIGIMIESLLRRLKLHYFAGISYSIVAEKRRF